MPLPDLGSSLGSAGTRSFKQRNSQRWNIKEGAVRENAVHLCVPPEAHKCFSLDSEPQRGQHKHMSAYISDHFIKSTHWQILGNTLNRFVYATLANDADSSLKKTKNVVLTHNNPKQVRSSFQSPADLYATCLKCFSRW